LIVSGCHPYTKDLTILCDAWFYAKKEKNTFLAKMAGGWRI